MQSAYAFILMGPVHGDENTLNMFDPTQAIDQNGSYTIVTSSNLTDDLGGPKAIKEFYRWNTPHLVYGFDREFVRFFGEDGILAVNEAMGVLNDFFKPKDGQYSGVSELDLMRDGYQGNYSTYWLNTTAKNENLMDIKSLVLGMMVNYLGLGNPYRQMFTATNAWYADPLNPGSVVLGTTLKNFDPITLKPTDYVNGDQYAYRLIHNQVPGFLPDPSANNVAAVTLDMEEFTNSDTVNTYSAVSAIVDAFYGNTDMVWTRVPSRYGFGIYYDGLNAMGGSYKPRHALTYDDAGGLKYMYNTNTVVMEYTPYDLVKPADFTQTLARYNLAPYDDALLNRIGGVFPTRNALNAPGIVAQSHPLYSFLDPKGPGADGVYGTVDDVNLLDSFMAQRDPANPGVLGFVSAGGRTPGKMAWAFRGGIDSIQFHEVSYDSLLNMSHFATNYTWIDTFMTNASIRTPILSTVTNTAPGASIALTDSLSNYYQQTLGRSARTPDFIFSADQYLGFAANQVQTAWIREAPVDDLTAPAPDDGGAAPWSLSPTRRTSAYEYNAFLYYTSTAGAAGPGIWSSQPGGWNTQAPIYAGYDGLHMVFNSSINIGGFEVVWSGESSVVGNQLLPIQYQQWAWIRGPGSSDFTKFPRDYDVSNRLIENTILPITAVPVISMVSDNGGLTSISPTSLSRTEEKITMIGTGFLAATAIEVLDPSGAVVQVFSPADSFVKHDKLIEIPADTFSYKSEGLSRQMRVWNPVGPSELSKERFNINSGRPQIYSTSADNVLYDRGTPLTIFGSGFKSKKIHLNDNNATITHIRVDDLSDGTRWPVGGIPVFGHDVSTSLEVISDKKAILHGGVFPSLIDTQNGIRIRVSRGSITSISPPTESYIPAVTGKPGISLVRFMDDDSNLFIDVNETSALRRDAALIIDGTGLNSVTSIEIVRMDGYSFTPAVYASLATHANILDSGTRITLQPYAFSENSADGHTSFTAKLRIVNPFGTVMYSAPFNVNIQPPYLITLLGTEMPNALSQISAVAGRVWNRDSAETGNGMDIEFHAVGGGLKAIERIRIIEDGGAPGNSANWTTAYIDIPNGGSTGVAVADTKIVISAKNAQWNNIINGDSANVNDWKRFRLESDRNACYTGPQPDRVIIGQPPVVVDYALNGTSVERDYERDNHKITIIGSNLQLAEFVEVVDNGGSSITDPVPTIVQRSPYLQIPNFAQHSVTPNLIDLNSTIWTSYTNMGYADTIAGPSAPATSLGRMDGRRLRVANVFSMVTPVYSTALDTFTQSARPDFSHDLSRIFNGAVYHGGRGSLAEEEHWIDINGSAPNNQPNGGFMQQVILTVNPGVGGTAIPTQSGSLMGVRSVYFESNRTAPGPDLIHGTEDDWTDQRVFQGVVGGVPFNYPTAQFDINGSGWAAGGGIKMSTDGRTMTLEPWFIQQFNIASSDISIPINERAPLGAGDDGVTGTVDDLGYWNENSDTGVGRGVVHRIRFETVAGKIANTQESDDGDPAAIPPVPVTVDNGLFYTYIKAMEEGVGAYIRDVGGPGFIAGSHWERNSTLHITGPGLDNATLLRFVDADQNTTITSTSAAGNVDTHMWLNMAAVGITAVALPPVGTAPNEWTLVIPGDLAEIAADGHLVDSASDTMGELRRVQVMFLDGTTKYSTLHAFTICRPIEWPDLATADDVFEGKILGDPTNRADDGLYFSKNNTFGWRDGEYLRVSSTDWHNNMRGVKRIDFVDDLGAPVGALPNTFLSTGIDFNSTGDGPNIYNSWDASKIWPNGGPVTAVPNGGARDIDSSASFLYIPWDVFSNPVRIAWFEGASALQNRALRFTMRSGTEIVSPLIMAGRAPTFIGLDTDGPGLPLLFTGTPPVTQGTYFAINRNRVAPDLVTNIQFDATDVNRTRFTHVFFALSDDVWPFGNGTADIPAPAFPEAEVDDFPPALATRQYPPSAFITANASIPPASAPGVRQDNILFLATLLDDAPFAFPPQFDFAGAENPGDDNQTAWNFFVLPPSMRMTRQVVVETIYGQASSEAEIANPADAKQVTLSSLWDFPYTGLPANIGHTNPELNATFEVNSTDPSIPGQNGWNGNTSTVVLAAGNNLVINTPDLNPLPFNGADDRVPIAGGVRALQFSADNNMSSLTILHDDYNIIPLGVPNAGQVNRAFYVQNDLKQLVLNGDYIAEQKRLEVGTPAAAAPGSYTTVFVTPATSVAAGPWPVNGGGIYMQVISAAGQNWNPAAPLTAGEPNVIGPFGAQ